MKAIGWLAVGLMFWIILVHWWFQQLNGWDMLGVALALVLVWALPGGEESDG